MDFPNPDRAVCISSHDDPEKLIPLLKSHLPYSLPLLRRLQHHLAFPSSTANVLSTFPGADVPSSPWLAAYVDLSQGRETQMTFYSSLEREATLPDNGSDSVSTFLASPETLALGRAQILELLSYIKAHLLPDYLSYTQSGGSVDHDHHPPNTPGQVPPPSVQAFLIGNLHTALFSLLTASGNYYDPNPARGLRIHRYDTPPYVKYLFKDSPWTTCNANSTTQLPPGYRFHDRQGRTGVLPHHFDLVRSRTHLPRSNQTLARIPGVAVYADQPCDTSTATEEGSTPSAPEEAPIAWVFLGLDGSLATLFVEPEHRGKGLAVPLSQEVMRIGMAPGGMWRGVGGEDEAWLHSNVLATNQSSRRVSEKLGGEVGWTITWTVVEVL